MFCHTYNIVKETIMANLKVSGHGTVKLVNCRNK
jgi:hypothetical protein